MLVDDSDSFPIKIIDFGMAIPMFRRDEVIYVAFIFEYSDSNGLLDRYLFRCTSCALINSIQSINIYRVANV